MDENKFLQIEKDKNGGTQMTIDFYKSYTFESMGEFQNCSLKKYILGHENLNCSLETTVFKIAPPKRFFRQLFCVRF